jgi:hypothetical protein
MPEFAAEVHVFFLTRLPALLAYVLPAGQILAAHATDTI